MTRVRGGWTLAALRHGGAEQAGAERVAGGRLGVDLEGGDALGAAELAQGGHQRVADGRVVELADRAARRVAEAPADQRDPADQHLGAGERLVGALPHRDADRAPAGGLAQLAPLPELREAPVRGVLDEGVPGVAVGDAEGGELRHRP